MQSTSVFIEIMKVADLRWKNADDVSRIQGECHLIYIVLGSPLGKI